MTDLDEKFVFMNNQGIYVRSAIQSSLLGVAIAFVVLLVSTRVFHREYSLYESTMPFISILGFPLIVDTLSCASYLSCLLCQSEYHVCPGQCCGDDGNARMESWKY